MSDEARHVAFGVLSLKEFYDGLTDAEMRERQEFAFEAAVRMRDRFLQQEVWERMGVDVEGGHQDLRRARRGQEPGPVPAAAVLQDRPELQEARPARRQRRLAAQALRRARRHPVRGLGRHRRGVRSTSTRSPRTAKPPPPRSPEVPDSSLPAAGPRARGQVLEPGLELGHDLRVLGGRGQVGQEVGQLVRVLAMS